MYFEWYSAIYMYRMRDHRQKLITNSVSILHFLHLFYLGCPTFVAAQKLITTETPENTSPPLSLLLLDDEIQKQTCTWYVSQQFVWSTTTLLVVFGAKILVGTRSSGIENNPTVFYRLMPGSTAQTNKFHTFYLQQRPDNGDTWADIKVNHPLDYETIKEYNLTVRVEVSTTFCGWCMSSAHAQTSSLNKYHPLSHQHHPLGHIITVITTGIGACVRGTIVLPRPEKLCLYFLN